MTPQELKKIIARNQKQYIEIHIEPGWVDLILKLHNKLMEIDPDYIITQVKEKFAGLRYYAHTTIDSEDFQNIIDEYESRSYTICQVCGKPGKFYDLGWDYTLCGKHADEYKNRLHVT